MNCTIMKSKHAENRTRSVFRIIFVHRNTALSYLYTYIMYICDPVKLTCLQL